MGTSYNTKTLLLFVLIVSAFSIKAQDIHFTQFGNSHLNLNPALTGSFDGTVRINGNYRSQWTDVPVDYETFTLAADWRPISDCVESPFALGLLFNYDVQGDSRMTLNQIELAGSYRHRLSRTNFIMAGVMIGGMQRGFEPDELRWDIQFDGKQFNPGLSGETIPNSTNFMVDFSAGFNWHVQGDKVKSDPSSKSGSNTGGGTNTNSGNNTGTKNYPNTAAPNPPVSTKRTFARPSFAFDFGAAIFHLNRPNASFFDNDDVQLRSRISLYGFGGIRLSNHFDLTANAMAQFQGAYTEVVAGPGLRGYINTDPENLLALELGVLFRFGDAFAPNFQLIYKNWRAGFSWDVNTSPFQKATNRIGGPELSFRYLIAPPCVIECTTCPDYF